MVLALVMILALLPAAGLPVKAGTGDFSVINAPGTSIVYSSEGELPWQCSADGFAYSGNTGFNSTESTLKGEVTLDEDMLLSFEVWVQGESPDYDYGIFMLDGIEKEDWVITEGWVQYSIPLEKGKHDLRWIYIKDVSDSGDGDIFRLRNVSLKKRIPKLELRVEMKEPGVYFEEPGITPQGDVHYSVGTAGWFDGSYARCNSFVAGDLYSLQVVLRSDEGYCFYNTEVLINGKDTMLSQVDTNDTGSEMLIQTNNYVVKTNKFSDVPIRPWAWNYEGIYVACSYGIMTGYAKEDDSQQTTTFRPKNNVNRAEMVMILAGLSGDHWANQTSTGFSDVPYNPNKEKQVYYFDNLAWASFHGIVNGYTDGTFRPKEKITRADMAVMLYRLYHYMYGYDSEAVGDGADITGFADYEEVPKYAREAMSWAYANGIISGRNGGTVLAPKEFTQRQECASVVQRFIDKFYY